jgi:hypothetical protein
MRRHYANTVTSTDLAIASRVAQFVRMTKARVSVFAVGFGLLVVAGNGCGVARAIPSATPPEKTSTRLGRGCAHRDDDGVSRHDATGAPDERHR